MSEAESSKAPGRSGLTRREFLRASTASSATIGLVASALPAHAASLFEATHGDTVSREPWGRIEEVADGVWVLVSTPLEDQTTVCNGGIIRGSDAVIAIESFATPTGASWFAERTRALTGRWPDAVVLTHFHGDHTGGIDGYARKNDEPRLRLTAVTRELVLDGDARRKLVAPPRGRMLDAAELVDGATAATIDLGGRTVRIVPREGHTRSDVTVEIDDPSIVFCGDLVWNRMFPNYVDSIPSLLGRDVRALMRDRKTTYVSGHGPVASDDDLRQYLALLDDVERVAREAHENGETAEQAGKRYQVPTSLGEWIMFNPRYPAVAISSWLRELSG